MKHHDVQDIHIEAPVDRVFALVADAARTPDWTQAFVSVDGSRAVMRTPNDEVEIGLEVLAEAKRGTVDWRMSFPDGTLETAYSRMVPTRGDQTIFTFVLQPPGAALEELEGGLAQQSATLACDGIVAAKRLPRRASDAVI